MTDAEIDRAAELVAEAPTFKTFTFFIQDDSGRGTIWINTARAISMEAAQAEALMRCADDWGYERTDDLHVLGIADGGVRILHWNDIED